MKDCIFCKIINNELPSYKIFEDEKTLVFMTIDPVSNGHLLMIPKKHYENILDMPNDEIENILNILREKIYPLLKEKMHCDGITLSQNNEYGQEIKHYHLHVIPKYKNKENKLDIEEVFNILTK